MRSVTVTRDMTAARAAVWEVLADFPNIAAWNTGVKASHATSDATSGVGARRHCDLAPVGTLEETIAEWDEGNRLVVNIDSATKLPIERGVATFTLTENTTTIDYEFAPKGLIGKLFSPLLSKQLGKGFAGFLVDLDAAANASSKT